MEVADKIAKAGIIAAYLIGLDIKLEVELSERHLYTLIDDPDFERYVLDRAYPCADCGVWMHRREIGSDGIPVRHPKYCDDCSPGHARRDRF